MFEEIVFVFNAEHDVRENDFFCMLCEDFFVVEHVGVSNIFQDFIFSLLFFFCLLNRLVKAVLQAVFMFCQFQLFLSFQDWTLQLIQIFSRRLHVVLFNQLDLSLVKRHDFF